MITYSHYRPSDAHGVVDVWNQAMGEQFPLDLRLWRQNVDDSAYTLSDASLVARDDDAGDKVVGFLIVKSPKHIGAIAVAPGYQRQGIATEMVALAEQAIGADTSAGWVVGQDYNHFFPGTPAEYEPAQLFFEQRLGFARGGGVVCDLARDLSAFEIDPNVRVRIEALKQAGIELGPCDSHDLPALIDHIGVNFSGRWLKDTIHRLDIETNPSEIMIAKRAATGQVIGFAHTFSGRSRFVGPSIYWRALLGPKYGGLGPIGVAQDVRKIGLGLALLAYSVQSVKERGATHMAIDWTNLVDFYAKVGFAPWKKYVSFRQA